MSYENPKWWNARNDSAWERVKAAFKRDWDQTKHDLGGHEPDTDQNVTDTLKQATGKEVIPPRRTPNFEQAEHAYRFGTARARNTVSVSLSGMTPWKRSSQRIGVRLTPAWIGKPIRPLFSRAGITMRTRASATRLRTEPPP